jgi:hypothetical protein
MQLGISEILSKISSEPDLDNRKRMLATCATNQGVLAIFRLAFDPSIVWNLPEGAPPYKPCQYGDQQAMLYQSLRKMYLFLGDGNPNVTQLQKEKLFINTLESLDPDDAKLLLSVKEKTLPYANVTEDMVREVFPGLLPEGTFQAKPATQEDDTPDDQPIRRGRGRPPKQKTA